MRYERLSKTGFISSAQHVIPAVMLFEKCCMYVNTSFWSLSTVKHCCLKRMVVLVIECYPVEILATKRGSSNTNLHYINYKNFKGKLIKQQVCTEKYMYICTLMPFNVYLDF